MQHANLPTLIVIAGPTAVGKTAISIALAKYFDTEIISADSRQCYQGMSIGTAQPTALEMNAVKHHFINCYTPDEALTAADFEKLSLDILDTLFYKKNIAIACGGTGLYLKALCEGLDPMPAIDQKINEETIKKYSENGISWLRNELQNADPIYFSKGEIENPSRMLRALAFSLSVGRSITEFQTGIAKERPFRIIKIGLEMPRDLLYQRINLRVDQMMKDGLLEEAQNLYPIRHLKNLNTVGYSELFDYFDNQTSLAIAIDKIKQHSRNYAKRQLTWFKKDKDFNWFDANDNNLVEKLMNFIANS